MFDAFGLFALVFDMIFVAGVITMAGAWNDLIYAFKDMKKELFWKGDHFKY